MGYRFSGFFTRDGSTLLVEAVQQRWPEATVRPIVEPFPGYGFAFAPDEGRPAAFEMLPRFSARFPEAVFVWIDADCFAGVCLYDGFACRAGAVLIWQPTPASDALERLVTPLEVELGPDGNFAPLARGYFDS